MLGKNIIIVEVIKISGREFRDEKYKSPVDFQSIIPTVVGSSLFWVYVVDYTYNLTIVCSGCM